MWADPSEVCSRPGKAGARPQGILTWNVKASGSQKVVVYVVGKDGAEKNFGRGGPIGERQTGPWLRPGTIFKLRDMQTNQELGSMTIGEKAC